MTDRRLKILLTAAVLILPILGRHISSAQGRETDKAITLTKPSGVSAPMSLKHLNTDLLEDAIIYYTNIQRQQQDLPLLTKDTLLTLTARGHSDEMARMKYFSHHSPNTQRATLRDRLEISGVDLPGHRYGENLGVDYLLQISGLPFVKKWSGGRVRYYYSHGNREIQPQSYDHFARTMVDNWMLSKGHRANLLDPLYTRIGVGLAQGTYNSLDAIFATQNFIGRVQDAPAPVKPVPGHGVKR